MEEEFNIVEESWILVTSRTQTGFSYRFVAYLRFSRDL
jgi:hypothetical protein